VAVHPASVQDRDGASTVLRQARRCFPFIERIFADGGYQGPKLATLTAATGAWSIEIVKRSDTHRFVVLPKRWIVERTFAWLSTWRRLAKDFEVLPSSEEAWIYIAMIRIMLRRLAHNSS
jgi:transposase